MLNGEITAVFFWYVYNMLIYIKVKVKVKLSHCRSGVAQRVSRGIALLFHDRDTRRRWVVSSTPRPHFTPGKDPVPFLQEAGWALGPVWTARKSSPHQDSIPDRPARSQSLYRLSYRPHPHTQYVCVCVYTGCFTTCGHYCMRWFPRSLWSKKFI